MTPLDYFSWLVLIVIVVTAVVAVVALAQLPGKTATANNHPHAQAITVAGWLGIITGVIWMLALIWAYTLPADSGSTGSTDNDSVDQLKQRIADLEAQLAQGGDHA